MKTFSFFLTLLLTVAWGYTSWYWYTCNIKGFCNGETLSPSDPETNIAGEQDRDISSETSSAQKLSISDVLVEGVSPSKNSGETLSGSQNSVTASGESSNSIKENLMKDSQIKPDTSSSNETSLTICTGNFVGPIALGGKNDADQVMLLEKFLISQGELLEIDGEYTQSDVEAVKKFQLEYKQEILDPWSISAPTGYVFTTTVKKMKEIACQ